MFLGRAACDMSSLDQRSADEIKTGGLTDTQRTPGDEA